MIGCSGTNWTELEQAVTYNRGMSHISSKLFLSDLSRAFRNDFHSCFSSDITIRNEGTVLPIIAAITPTSIFAMWPPSQSSITTGQVLGAIINSRRHLGERGAVDGRCVQLCLFSRLGFARRRELLPHRYLLIFVIVQWSFMSWRTYIVIIIIILSLRIAIKKRKKRTAMSGGLFYHHI